MLYPTPLRFALLLPLFVALLTTSFVSSEANCYYPNGTSPPPSANHHPCINSSSVTFCCAGNDECLTNGLCRPAGAAAASLGYWRKLCTDQSWQSPACPKYCYNDSTSLTASSGNYHVLACSADTYCCNNNVKGEGASCCNDSQSIFSAGPPEWLSGPHLAMPILPSSASVSNTASIFTSTSTAPTSGTMAATSSTNSPAVQDHTSTSLSTGAKAGIGVGVALAALLAISLIAFVILGKRRAGKEARELQEQSDNHTSSSNQQPHFGSTAEGIDAGYGQPESKAELSSEAAKVELGADGRPVEMGGEREPVELEGIVEKRP